MGVLGGQRRLFDQGWQLAVEPGITGAAEQPRAGHDHRGMVGLGRVERADELGVAQLGGPLDAQRSGSAMQALYVARVGRRKRAQQPDPGGHHQRCCAHPDQQRDLGVPLLDGMLGAELQPPPVALNVYLLFGEWQRDTTALGFLSLPQLADLLEQYEQLVRLVVVDRALGAGIRQLLARPHQCTLHLHVGALAGRVDLDLPQQRRADLVGQQGPGALGDQLRVQRNLGVGAVERLAAQVRLKVDRLAGCDERGDVGDRVVDRVAVAGSLDVQRLVEVHGTLGVDRHERQVGPVELRQPGAGRRLLSGGLHVGRKTGRDLHLGLDPRHSVAQVLGRNPVVGGSDPQHSVRHA